MMMERLLYSIGPDCISLNLQGKIHNNDHIIHLNSAKKTSKTLEKAVQDIKRS